MLNLFEHEKSFITSGPGFKHHLGLAHVSQNEQCVIQRSALVKTLYLFKSYSKHVE